MRDSEDGLVDAIDQEILRALAEDGRMSNAALARRLGVAESTSIHRVRSLIAAGVITGFHAQLDRARIGLPIEAVIHVEMKSNSRRQLDSFAAQLAGLPGLITAFAVAGVQDYILHVAVPDPDSLRDLVNHRIASHPAVGRTETQLVFETIAGEALMPWSRGRQPK